MNCLLFLLMLPYTVSSLTCTSCPFHLQPPHPTVCNDTCEGDLCYIVVNKYYNGTVIAGCLHMKEGDEFRNQTSVCSRSLSRTMCACTTKDKCNSPMSPLMEFEFVEDDILEGYQVMPQILPEANVSSQIFTSSELREGNDDKDDREPMDNNEISNRVEDNSMSKRTRPAFPITSSSDAEIEITKMGSRFGEINDERQTTRSMNPVLNSSEDDTNGPLRLAKLSPPTVNPSSPIDYELTMTASIGSTTAPTDSSNTLLTSFISIVYVCLFCFYF